MIYTFEERSTDAYLCFVLKDKADGRAVYQRRASAIYTIAYNNGPDQEVLIDGSTYVFAADHLLPLMSDNHFTFSKPEQIIAWQYNREFYCILDHDKEVSCAGFLYYGTHGEMFIKLEESDKKKVDALSQVFVDEFSEQDNIQGQMLRMLLTRLIILTTRLAKKQHVSAELDEPQFDIARQFGLLVEEHYKEHHQVQDYATLMHKSPKTLSNLFAKFSNKSPLQIILDRVALEAKRLLLYTDLTSKEIAFELGFDDPSTFSRFFKKQVGQSPSAFKKSHKAD